MLVRVRGRANRGFLGSVTPGPVATPANTTPTLNEPRIVSPQVPALDGSAGNFEGVGVHLTESSRSLRTQGDTRMSPDSVNAVGEAMSD
ncbi:hypothetical protein V2G26_012414 [Clonostachys chloroleuca]